MLDYNCDILYNRTQKDQYGKLMFDKEMVDTRLKKPYRLMSVVVDCYK